jgi:hypothetical protein
MINVYYYRDDAWKWMDLFNLFLFKILEYFVLGVLEIIESKCIIIYDIVGTRIRRLL